MAALTSIHRASIEDIGLMKLDAIVGRGSRKDFYDLYCILKIITLEVLLNLSKMKFQYFRDFPLLALEHLALFDNGDRDIQPNLLIDVPWPEIKQFFVHEVKQLGKKWLIDP
jgi:hypothetical protein